MSKAGHITTNFTAGELSPRLFGRTDLKKYHSGVSDLENFLIQTHGGIERRSGTKFVAQAHGTVLTATPPRLIEFQYNVEQSYVLEFGVTVADGGYIRFFRLDSNGDPSILMDTTAGSDPTILVGLDFTAAELGSLQFTQSADVLFVFSETKPISKLSRTGTNDSNALHWSFATHEHNEGAYLPVNTTDTTVKASAKSGTGVTLTASDATVFASTDADGVGRVMRFEDDSDEYTIASFTAGATSAAPAVIEVSDSSAMFLIAGDGTEDGKRVEFLRVTKGATFLNDTVFEARNFVEVGGGVTSFEIWNIDGTPAHFTAIPNTAHDNGDGVCRFERTLGAGWGRIRSVAGDLLTATIDIENDLPMSLITAGGTTTTTNWKLGAWSTATGYPQTGTFYQDRLWVANTTKEPQTIWASATGNFSCFSPSTLDEGLVLDTNAITVTLADSQVNEINWISGDTSGLLILTSGGEWLGRSSSQTAAITPSDLGFRKQSRYGSSKLVKPVRAGTALLFMQRNERVLRELIYEFAQDRFVAPNISLLSEHITGTGVTDSAYQQGISNRLWLVRDDGVLLTMTYEKEEEVIAWHRQVLAPSAAAVAALALSIATTRDINTDNLWILTNRDINGTQTYFIEFLENRLEAGDAHDTAYCLDCGLTGTDLATPQTVWSGLDHLEGETVYALADGISVGGFTVNSGAITLNTAANQVSIGLQYTSTMQTMPIALLASSFGQAVGRLKRAAKNYINIYRTLGGNIGTPDQLYPVEYPTETATVLNTMLLEVNTPDNASRESIIKFTQSDAHPSNVLSIITEFAAGDV